MDIFNDSRGDIIEILDRRVYIIKCAWMRKNASMHIFSESFINFGFIYCVKV